MRIAYFTLISPQKTGIADYSEKEILPYLNGYVDLDIFIDEHVKPTNPFILENFNIYKYSDYKKNADLYDTAIYHMGNNRYHKFIYDALIDRPGITVLHDIHLHGFLWSYTLSSGCEERYIEEFRYCYGEAGAKIAKKAIKTGSYPEFDYLLIKRIIDNSLGVVCHSDYGVKKALIESDGTPIIRMNQPFTVSDRIKKIDILNREELKAEHKLERNFPVIASFGYIFTHKRYHILFKAFKRLLKVYPDAVLLLIGEDLMGIGRLISDMGLEESVVTTGYVSYEHVLDYLAISDFCVNLRYPTAGETSRSVLQLMAAEKPVIVSNVGWFSELPDNCCLKVDVDSYEGDILLEYMRLLASDEAFRNLIGKNAKEYVMNEHDPQKIAQKYYMFVKNILDGREYTLNKVSKEMADMGVRDEDTEIIRHLSKRISNLI